MGYVWSVLAWALVSRILVLIWSLASSRVVSAYDSSVSLMSNGSGMPLALGSNWDALYFNQIARHGYEYEQFHAFFPLLPTIAKKAVELAGMDLSAENIALAGVGVSNVAFICASGLLYKLGVSVLEDERRAAKAALLFSFGPYSVFMSAFYTESIFACLSFAGMLLMVSKPGSPAPSLTRLICGSLMFACATASRSNGIVLVGYVGYALLLPFLEKTIDFTLLNLIKAGLKFLCCATISAMPLVMILRFGYERYCTGDAPLNLRPWCESTVPNIYSFVQDHYWNVGLFRYMQVKQLPNFALAVPMASIAIRSVLAFVKRDENELLSRNVRVLPYVLHTLVLTVLCCFAMHVQILTRFISACPVLYWYLSENLIWTDLKFFSGFAMVGTAMFTCYYPWS